MEATDPLLTKIQLCRSQTTQFIAFLQIYPKPDDVKEFLSGLRAIENKLNQAYNMKKQLVGYNLLDAEPLDKIFAHLTSLREHFESLSKSKSLMRALKSISLRKKLERENTDLQKEVNKLIKTMNRNLELEEKRRNKNKEKSNVKPAPARAPHTPTTNGHPESPPKQQGWTLERTPSREGAPALSVGSSRGRAGSAIPASNPKNDLTLSQDRRNWFEEQAAKLLNSEEEDQDTHYVSLLADASAINKKQQLPQQSPRPQPPQTPPRKPIPTQDSHYTRLDRPVSPPNPGLDTTEDGHYDRIGAKGPTSPVTPRTNYSDLPTAKEPPKPYQYSPLSPPETPPPKSSPARPKSPRDRLQRPKPAPSSYDPISIDSSAYDPIMDEDEEVSSGSDIEEQCYEPLDADGDEGGSDSPVKLINDEDGIAMWKNFDNGSQFYVDWEDFERVFVMYVGRTHLSDTERRVLQHIMDNSGTGGVSAYKFSEFLKGFGPLKVCLENVVKILTQKWFHGFLSRVEAEKLLTGEEVGTYLVRFSITRPGSFALALVARSRAIAHILIERNFPDPGVKVEEVKKGKKTTKVFDSLFEVLHFYNSRGLRTPFTSSYLKQSWFHGDLTSEDAVQILSGEEVGTFLVRFSTQAGNFATSYVAKNKKVSHSRIEKTPGGFKDIQTGNVWPTLEDMVAKCQLTLKTPLPNSRTDIYVFQRNLASTDNNNNSSSNGYVENDAMQQQDNYQGLAEDSDDENETGLASPRTNYTVLPSGKPGTPRQNGRHNQKAPSDNYGIMDYEV